MFIGHFAAGFAVKKVEFTPSLGTMFMATQFVDLLWPVFILLGLETVEIDPGNTVVTPLNFVHYPWTHSLVGALVWAVLFGGIYFAIRKNLKASLWLAGLVVSHWVLDLISHRPDLPLSPDESVMVGLGLWNSLTATIIVEGGIFALGVYLYVQATRALNKKGKYALIGLVAFLLITYFMNLFGPVPPSAEAIPYSALSMWLLIAWGYWIDRNREVK
jgi:membrane-bound metal-dependent hydrolase YbcI (DUF457 family)